MRTKDETYNYKSTRSFLRVAALSCLALAVPPITAQHSDAHHGAQLSIGDGPVDAVQTISAKLVQIVRDATRPFVDVNAATAAGYLPFLGCISGPDHGAMGVHYVNSVLVGDGMIDASRPEALIYEASGGAMRLVGVEFIVDSATWLAKHDSPPVLEGQSFQFVGSPNRYGLAAFFELHVWAWRNNPNGAFVDWNTRVSCEGN